MYYLSYYKDQMRRYYTVDCYKDTINWIISIFDADENFTDEFIKFGIDNTGKEIDYNFDGKIVPVDDYSHYNNQPSFNDEFLQVAEEMTGSKVDFLEGDVPNESFQTDKYLAVTKNEQVKKAPLEVKAEETNTINSVNNA